MITINYSQQFLVIAKVIDAYLHNIDLERAIFHFVSILFTSSHYQIRFEMTEVHTKSQLMHNRRVFFISIKAVLGVSSTI